MSVKVRRRDFLKLLGGVGVVAAAGGLLPPLVRYVTPPILKGEMPRSLLVWGDCRTPVKASELKPNTNYIFYYPLVDTPNILLKLESPDGKPIRIPEVKVPANMNAALEPPAWLDGSVDEGELAIIQKIATSATFYTYPGGVGKDKNIIAYSAICQHLGCPFPALKYYPPGTPTPPTNPPEVGANGGVLHCLCHGSAYDPSRGAIVLTPPTVKPQPYIKLEWDPATDQIYAVDVIGPTILGKVCNTCGKTVGPKIPIAEEKEPEKPSC